MKASWAFSTAGGLGIWHSCRLRGAIYSHLTVYFQNFYSNVLQGSAELKMSYAELGGYREQVQEQDQSTCDIQTSEK